MVVKESFDILYERSSKVFKIHNFNAKKHTSYIETLKTILKRNELIIGVDFAENYFFIVYDEIWSFWWNKNSAAIYPFVVYHEDEDDLLKHDSYAIISGDIDHLVYSF